MKPWLCISSDQEQVVFQRITDADVEPDGRQLLTDHLMAGGLAGAINGSD